MEYKGKSIHKYSEEKWLRDFVYLVNITGHLNDLNYHLLGKDLLVFILYYFVKAFERKLILWESQLLNENSTHFQKLMECVKNSTTWNSHNYVQCISNSKEEFKSRFSNFCGNEIFIRMFSPFSVDVGSVPPELQLEFIDYSVTLH
ncbi:General transcription factor II-I repeat domain-containing protein 2, partial [Stegodyphus mimosarum]